MIYEARCFLALLERMQQESFFASAQIIAALIVTWIRCKTYKWDRLVY